MKYSKHNNEKKFLSGKGFYLALAACIGAVGIAAWSAAATITTAERDYNSSYSSSVPDVPSSSAPDKSEQTGQNVSNVEDTRSEVSSKVSSTAPTSSKDTSSQKSASFTMPLKGSVGKNFSDSTLQYSATFGDMRLHLGVDLQAKQGTDVVAATKGTVKKITDDSLWGKMVSVDHGYGITVNYCGLKNLTVNEGESIASGTKIGEVGVVPSECEDKDHIHIAVIKDGKYISPLDLLALKK